MHTANAFFRPEKQNNNNAKLKKNDRNEEKK